MEVDVTVGGATAFDKAQAAYVDLEPARHPLDARLFGIALFAVCAVGVVLRAIHLDIPMRYDETVTYMSYASEGWEYVTRNYQNPNNHVFHSLLVSWLTSWLGNAPAIIRLPAFLAGCALVPLTAWVGSLAHGRAAGFVAAAFVATSPVLIEFSTNARGYSLLSLCVLLAIFIGMDLSRGRGWVAWVALVEVGVIGFYTIPTMAIPWLGITLWLGMGLYGRGSAKGSRIVALAPLVLSTAAVAMVVLALYSGIVVNHGLDAIVGNRFVVPEPTGSFIADTPLAIGAVMRHWSRGVPRILALLGAVSVGLGLWWGRRSREWMSLLGALLAGGALAMAVTRNWGESRIWLWMLPIVSITGAIGVVEALRRVGRLRHGELGVVIGMMWSVVMSLQIVLAHPVRASLETGAFPEGREVFDGIIDRYRRGDGIVGDFVSVEPLRFYLKRWAATHEPPPRSAIQRSWVVVNRGAPERAGEVRARLLRMGAPPLEDSNPAFTVGEVAVYLFGRPAGSPDPRLLEAIDWYTGVAGRVDDERALALMLQVADETQSPLAEAWIARCYWLGCLGFEGQRSGDVVGLGDAMREVRELALTGDVEAEFLLGSSYAEGWAGESDPAGAARWYRRAAEGGHILAARSYGSLYRAGLGVEQSDSTAVRWWRAAADAGDAVAELRLGQALEEGRGVARDAQAATTWYTRSSERGNAQARDALRRLSGR